MNATSPAVDPESHPISIPDHKGTHYLEILKCTHEWLSPANYFEIGTATGDSLALAKCATLAVDPDFQVGPNDVVGKKRFCALYQMTSDAFFRCHDPTRIFEGPIDLAFLDGLHYCENLLRDFANTERHCRRNSIITMHDCVPVDTAIVAREGAPPIEPHRGDWWAGDVWRTLVVLMKRRRDLAFTVLDSQQTGLAFVTNLDPHSTLLFDDYSSIVREMFSLKLEQIGFQEFFSMIQLEHTSVIDTKEKMSRRFWV
jgi:hypothetical protein